MKWLNSFMNNQLTLKKGVKDLRKHLERKKWAEEVGDALASKNNGRLSTLYAEWKLSGKKGDMRAFLREVSRTHNLATLSIKSTLKKAARQEQKKPLLRRRLK